MRASTWLAFSLAASGVPAAVQGARAGTVTTLYNFNQNGDACSPVLSAIAGGLLYGTTQLGGKQGYGLLFSVDPKAGTLTHLHDFTGGADAQNPSGVILYNGLLYGVAEQTPMPAHGNVYSVDPSTGAFTVIYAFSPYQDGVLPGGPMTVVNGLLYGGTAYGGTPDHGGVFTVDPATGAEAFSALSGGRGKNTGGPLLQVGQKLYDVAGFGGGANAGSIFAFDLESRRIKLIYGFKGGQDGAVPDGPLVRVGKTLFGTTNFGGGANFGTVFKIDLATGTESVVHSFKGVAGGQYPAGYLAPVNGLLYGTTNDGGTDKAGTIYTIDPASGAFTVVYDFTGGTSDYGGPLYGLLYKDGVFYGSTGDLLLNDPCGTVFSYVP